MELVYLFDPKVGYGENQINLSEDLHINLVDLTLTVEQISSRLPTGFWGDPRINSVTAFVGENGTGKSRIICSSLLKRRDENTPSILIIRESNMLKAFAAGKYMDVEALTNLHFEIHPFNSDEYRKRINGVFYSNQIGSNPNIDISVNRDFSTQTYFTLVNRDKLANQKIDVYEAFRRSEIEGQVNFLKSDTAKHLKDFIDIDREVDATFDYNGTFYGSVFNSNFGQSIKNEIEGYQDNTVIYEDDLGKDVFMGIFFLLFLNYSRNTQIPKNSLECLERINLHENLASQIRELDKTYLLHGVAILLEYLDQNWELITNKQIRKNSKSFDFTLNSIFFSVDKSVFNRFLSELEKHLGDNIGRLKFALGVSTGENALLSLYSRIFNNELIKYEKKAFLIVIDEGDSFFHPEWSRVFIRNILKVIPKILGRATSIQFVITTHSPFILSDIPSKSIFYLTKGDADPILSKKENKTFGANIHDLLTDSFFMKNGTIGEFARSKILDLIKFLTSESTDKVETEWDQKSSKEAIDIIGEPLIRDQLLSLHNRRFPFKSKENIELKIQELQLQLQKIKNEKNQG